MTDTNWWEMSIEEAHRKFDLNDLLDEPPFQDRARLWYSQLVSGLSDFCLRIAYLQGVRLGHMAGKADEGVYLKPSYDDLYISYHHWYGYTKLRITDNDRHFVFNSVDAKNEWTFIPKDIYPGPELKIRGAQQVQSYIGVRLPGIQVKRTFRQCDMPFHYRTELWSKIETTHLDPVVAICERRGSKWYCRHCLERHQFALNGDYIDPEPKPAPAPKTERQKMSNKLRMTVFERDGFACKVCGRNPREDKVKLHADHIHPVSKGGKTEMDNLQTLCSDCNAGKRTTIIPEMKEWNTNDGQSA